MSSFEIGHTANNNIYSSTGEFIICTTQGQYFNEKTSQNPRRVAHCRVSSLVMVCRRSLANLLATETALLTRRQQSADHKDKVCQVGVTVNTE